MLVVYLLDAVAFVVGGVVAADASRCLWPVFLLVCLIMLLMFAIIVVVAV